MSHSPDWLQDSGPPPKGSVSSAAADSNNFTSSLELDDGAAPTSTSTAAEAGSSGSCVPKFVKCLNWSTSLFFLGIFILSATFQENDGSGSIIWLLYYALHAVMVAFYFFFRACANVACVDKPLLALGGAMLIFSVVMVSISAAKLSSADASDPGQDAAKFNDKEEKAFEVAGSTLGLISAMYHIAIWKFCCQSAKKENEDD